MNYKIVMSPTPGNLQYDVDNHMKRGWKPQGGVCIDATDTERKKIYYYQAMIYSPAPKPPGRV